jgi:hypothetical protein
MWVHQRKTKARAGHPANAVHPDRAAVVVTRGARSALVKREAITFGFGKTVVNKS